MSIKVKNGNGVGLGSDARPDPSNLKLSYIPQRRPDPLCSRPIDKGMLRVQDPSGEFCLAPLLMRPLELTRVYPIKLRLDLKNLCFVVLLVGMIK